MEIKHILHLYNRIGFGITPNELETLKRKTKKEIIGDLFESSKKASPIAFESYLLKVNPKDLRDDSKKRQKFFSDNANAIRKLNVIWINRIFNPKELLREKMTLFWTNHFVCKDRNLNHILTYNNTIRKFALGNFGDFTKAISKEAAMLKYLNNKQNIKNRPNENFSRELMELFTLGQGNYSEKDVKEAARAFTGYSHNFNGDFILNIQKKDIGIKEIFGKTNNFNGDDVINLILSKKQCARFICKKIYAYFVNDIVDKNHINELVSIFYQDYNIEKLMEYILLSEWFYEDKNIGVKIKSPIELLAGIHKIVPYSIKQPKQVLLLQRLLGQVLLYPPNVAGWKQGKGWIDTNTIVIRLRLPAVLLNNTEISYSEKEDFETVIKDFNKTLDKTSLIKTSVQWNIFEENYRKLNNEQLIENILVGSISNGTKTMLNQNKHRSKRDLCLQLFSLPEYQLC